MVQITLEKYIYRHKNLCPNCFFKQKCSRVEWFQYDFKVHNLSLNGLNDFRFGESIGGSLVVGNIAWPHPKVVEVGSLLSTIGAGLQSLTGAPRLLQAIAQDGIIPFLAPFQTLTSSGEPIRALGVTITICEIAVLIGAYFVNGCICGKMCRRGFFPRAFLA